MLIDKGIFIFYGLVDLTPEQAKFACQKIGYNNIKQFINDSLYGTGKLTYGIGCYEDIPVRKGEYARTTCIGVIIDNPKGDIPLIDQVSGESKSILDDIFSEIRRNMMCEHVPTAFGMHILYDECMD